MAIVGLSIYKLSKTERESKQHDKPFGCMFIVLLLLGYSASEFLMTGARSAIQEWKVYIWKHTNRRSLILSGSCDAESANLCCLPVRLNSYTTIAWHTHRQVLCSWQNSGICLCCWCPIVSKQLSAQGKCVMLGEAKRCVQNNLIKSSRTQLRSPWNTALNLIRKQTRVTLIPYTQALAERFREEMKRILGMKRFGVDLQVWEIYF